MDKFDLEFKFKNFLELIFFGFEILKILKIVIKENKGDKNSLIYDDIIS